MADTSAATITNNSAAHRLEATYDEGVAELTYRREGDRLSLTHTGVPDELEGRGIGGALVQAAVDMAAEEGLTVVPLCSFADAWLRDNDDVARRVTIDWPARG